MSWHLLGDAYACCSCSVGCPCAGGGLETSGSDGCCAVQIIDIVSGEIGDVDVAGTKVAAAVDWPGAMMSGNGTGRLYFDAETTPSQREALAALIGGRHGGAFSQMPELVPTVLPPIVAPIRKELRDGATTLVVGTLGEATVKPMLGADGEAMRLRGVGGFRDDVVLATGNGSWWHDPDLRQWEGGGYAEQSDIDWRG